MRQHTAATCHTWGAGASLVQLDGVRAVGVHALAVVGGALARKGHAWLQFPQPHSTLRNLTDGNGPEGGGGADRKGLGEHALHALFLLDAAREVEHVGQPLVAPERLHELDLRTNIPAAQAPWGARSRRRSRAGQGWWWWWRRRRRALVIAPSPFMSMKLKTWAGGGGA